MSSQKVVILGANSFLARNLYIYLKEKSKINSIYLYDKDDHFFDEKADYCKVDFFDMDSIRSINFNCDVIYLFNGITGTVRGFSDYSAFININEILLLNILTVYCEKRSTSKIVYPSTRLVYRGDLNCEVNEDSEKEFKSIYAITKYASENYIKLYGEMFGVIYCILRICTPYGTLLSDYGNYGTFEFFTNQAKSGKNITIFGDGKIVKTYTHIEDICYVMLRCGFLDDCTNNTYNVGGDIKSLQQIGNLIADIYGVDVENIEWPELDKKVDAGSTIFNSSKLDVILKYEYRKLKFEIR